MICLIFFSFPLQLVAEEVVSIQEEEQGTEMTISGVVETLLEVEAMVEMTLLERVSFQDLEGVKEDEAVKITNREEGEADREVA